MKKEIFQRVEIPEGIEIEVKRNAISVRGPNGENTRHFDFGNLEVKKEDNHLIAGCKNATKNEKKMINTLKAHVNNMISGISNKFEYKMKICYSHFPITAEVRGNELIIKNFLGEKENRKAKIPHGAEVKVDKEIITIESSNKETAGQAAANIERATRVSKRDRRVFQDGIFITEKAGKEI